jgi:imidazole glycerol-phosphate synthase subunit HisH
MSKKIVIIDYSLGNLFSVQQALTYCGADTIISHSPNDVKTADAIVLPGVGAFAEAMKYLRENKLDQAIIDTVDGGKPFLGVCLGMQLLFESSEEFTNSYGLGLISGSIKRFVKPAEMEKLHVPQVGWNTIERNHTFNWNNTVLAGVPESSYMYFVHSFYAMPTNPSDVLSVSEYGGTRYCSSVMKNNIVATQFHPEKSGEEGIKIYKNWLSKI